MLKVNKKHKKKLLDMLKVNNNDTRTTLVTSLVTWNIFYIFA